ncbi:hypothetical protein [Yoonia sp.]
MHPTLAKYDDLTVIGRDLTDAPVFTLTALVHDYTLLSQNIDRTSIG